MISYKGVGKVLSDRELDEFVSGLREARQSHKIEVIKLDDEWSVN